MWRVIAQSWYSLRHSGPSRPAAARSSNSTRHRRIISRIIEKNGEVPATVTQLPSPPAPVPRPPQETYSVVVTDVPVKDVLFALARDAGVNIDVSGDLQGNVTINAIDQTLPQILDRLSRQASIRYSLENGTLVVLPDAPYWQNYRVDYVNLARTSEGEVTVATQIATVGGSVDEEGDPGGGGVSQQATAPAPR